VIRAAEELGLQNQVMTAARSGGEIIGMLIVGSRDPDYRFGEREVRLVRLITDIIGPGMAHVRAVERERREAEDQRVLAELAAVCAREANPVDILNRMAVALRPLIPRPVTVFGYRHGDEMVYPRADGAWIRLPLDPTFEVVDEMGQSFTDELPEESDPTGVLRQLGVRANCTTPIRSAGEIVGYLLVGSRQAGFTFSRRERELMRLAAQIVGPAMENARAAMAAREEAEDQRILAEIAAIAAREPDADAIMNALPAAIAPLVPSPLVLNGLIRDHTAVYRVSDPALREMFGVEHAAVPFSPAGFEALERGQATGHTDDLPPEFRAAVSGVHAFALTHYQTAGLRVGTIMVATTDPEYTFSERVLALLRRAAQVVGPALDAARAQEEFDRQRELQGLILRSLTEGVVLLDSVGRAIFANTLGRKVLDAVGAPGMVDTWEESLAIVPEAVREDFSRAVRLGQAGHGRTSLTIDGRRVHLDYEFVPLDHPAFRALLVLADVTSQVQQQEEEERSRERMAQTSRLAALGELIGGVAHELNNPLTAILGFAEIIGLSEAAEPFAEEIGVIQKEALRVRNIVRDLLFIARPGTSERGVVPVADIVAHIERLRRSHWSQAGIAAEVRIDPECLAWGNEHQLTQVLLNLVTNAEQALAGREGARLVIAARRQGERVLLTVADNGKGMDDATRARIFEPFFTTRQGIGTGLGLPLSYSIVQSHLGTITVETAPGAGTTFVVDLPVHDEPAEPVEPESPRSRPATLRMLVIDDEPSLRKVCQRLVESLGHSCESAENADGALKLARSGDFDVVLCDYRLATETADQVLEGLELEAPHLIPRTILATGATTDAGVVRLVERYGLQLVAKPYGVEELSRILNESAARAG
jgi:signal transduction histidine kinase/ActR/RegA family two-component response regulator